jgi:hypothetical protein
MATMPLTLIKGDKKGSETDYRDALPVNMTAVLRPVLGAQGYMIQEAGLTEFGNSPGVCRGAIWNERLQMHFRIQGTQFGRVDGNGAFTFLGTVPGEDTVSLPYSFNTQGIIASGRFFQYSPGGGFIEITDPDLGNPIDGVWVDGYYFLTDGEFLYHTDINDETSIDPLKFATSEFSPDPTLAVGLTNDNKVIVPNRYTTEYFVNVATDNFAFQRVATRAVKIGIVGTHAIVEISQNWFMLGGRKEESVSVHQLGVGSATRVATREVDKIIGQYNETELASVVMESYEEDGYSHVILHLPNHTLKFNYTLAQAAGIEQAWTIIKSDVQGDDQWRGKHGIFETRLGEWVFGDKIDGRYGILDSTTALQYGQIVEWILFTPFVYLETQSIDEVQIETIPGFTTTNDATVFVSLTYDGVTHGLEYTMQYGSPADYGKRFIRYRFGYVSDWFALKFRGATRSRMAFALARIEHG